MPRNYKEFYRPNLKIPIQTDADNYIELPQEIQDYIYQLPIDEAKKVIQAYIKYKKKYNLTKILIDYNLLPQFPGLPNNFFEKLLMQVSTALLQKLVNILNHSRISPNHVPFEITRAFVRVTIQAQNVGEALILLNNAKFKMENLLRVLTDEPTEFAADAEHLPARTNAQRHLFEREQARNRQKIRRYREKWDIAIELMNEDLNEFVSRWEMLWQLITTYDVV